MNRYSYASKLVNQHFAAGSTIIDVGCRDAVMKSYFSSNSYFGIDVDPASCADQLVDISCETPFADEQFDVLLALDVAEHTDDIYAAVLEMLRISKGAVIALPNLYSAVMRYRFVMGRPLSNKYRLTKDNSKSGGARHRWLFNLVEAECFMKALADEKEYNLNISYYYPSESYLERIIAKLLPNSWSSETIFFVFTKNRE
ncbi:class I SAM-dependent methyltransferase [Motiliproteus sp.]|uniref:class I SAM-dependent methyltransferase n=1 Tax=Motiliproteus sp. TaxID=1898955 RepID=UPI003BAD5005